MQKFKRNTLFKKQISNVKVTDCGATPTGDAQTLQRLF